MNHPEKSSHIVSSLDVDKRIDAHTRTEVRKKKGRGNWVHCMFPVLALHTFYLGLLQQHLAKTC